jgi:chromosome segregation ATPase
MWDPRDKVVILNHVSLGGVTLVNGEAVKGRRNVSHGDKIRVQGKGITYDFILDARPAGIASSDPKHMQSENKKRRQMRRELEQRRESLRDQISQVDKAVVSCEARSFDKEKEFYEIMARRRVRFKETQTKEQQIKEFNSEIEQLRVKLSLSRDEWLQRLQDTMDNQAKEIEPLTTATNDVQLMLEKLQQKKIELERELHPEKFEIQKMDILDEVSELTDRAMSASHAATPIADADVEGEEEASFGQPLSLEDGPKRASDAAQPEAKSVRVS